MCRISGIINASGSQVIENMVRGQKHGGPDGSGITFDGSTYSFNVSLGHNRLSIIDTSKNGAQPMQNDRFILTFNGEIYNYKELKSYLQEYEFKSTSDTEVVLNYIDCFGVDKFLKDAIGMFAFGVFDRLNTKLTLAVDQFSQKPIYWTHTGKTFAFASQPNVLFELIPKTLNPSAVKNYFCLGAPFGDEFIVNGIFKLQGSHKLEFEKNKVKISRYWEPEFQTSTTDIDYYINEAIERVKVADVPVYLFLSGGIDSTVCATRMRGYNAVHLNGPEAEYAQLVADKYEMQLSIVDPDPENAAECFNDVIRKTGVPGMSSLVPYITAKYVSKYAKCGIIANGADELFYGYDRIYSPNVRKNRDRQMSHLFRMDFMTLDAALNNPVPVISDEFGASGRSRWLELNTFVQYDLNQTLDQASMCHGLEVRSPFLDHKLVELALSISDTQHLMEFGNKSILKRKLHASGFKFKFTSRQKLGFSLYSVPLGYDQLKLEAYDWCINEGIIPNHELNARDLNYTMSAAASFYLWFKEYMV